MLSPMPSNTLSPLPLMELATGFWSFKTLASAYEMGLFERLSGTSGTTAGELADRLGIASRPAEMLLTGCAALGLLDRQNGRYVNSPLSDEYLVPGKPNHFGGLVTMFDRRLYAGWDKLTQAIRTNRPTTWDPDRERSLFDNADPEMVATFWEAMHAMSTLTGRALGAAFDVGGFRRLLDVGGGSAAFDIVLCQRYPELRTTVYDLEFVADIAARNVDDAGLTDRITVTPGDFFEDASFPVGHDLHLFSMIMHDWNEERDQLLLRKSFEALDSGGAVLICELVVDDDKTGPVPAALMSLNMLVETEGRNYTAAEYGNWLTEVGFVDPQVVPFEAPGANGVVTARKP
jgi:3-hydroxy-5-methyl-1-naphthoate 3-O-methyltransferase